MGVINRVVELATIGDNEYNTPRLSVLKPRI